MKYHWKAGRNVNDTANWVGCGEIDASLSSMPTSGCHASDQTRGETTAGAAMTTDTGCGRNSTEVVQESYLWRRKCFLRVDRSLAR